MRVLPLGMIALLFLSACSQLQERDGPPLVNRDVSKIPNAVPRVEPLSRSGNKPVYEVFGKRYHTLKDSKGYREQGLASWYGTKFHGKQTSSGEPYDLYGMTAAHRSLPLPTYARITNLKNQQSVIVKINDRGPFYSDRLIDLSYAAAKKLGIAENGTGFVEVEAIDPLRYTPHYPSPDYAERSKPHTTLESYADSLKVYIQIGAFADKTNAEALQKEVSTLAKTVIQSGYQDNKLLYKVRVGPFQETTQAESMQRKLADTHVRNGVIVID